ncbi:ATP-binding cassette domain-containing protein [Paracoccus yeei]|uniref:ATP-binding cassette domain-containing protein n=1 Tax=Paracoccus yeei TaxID=147645 RepID=UPI0028D89C38|nr:ATP-binding cassette domain-containing protein [Paracoccus yeei]
MLRIEGETLGYGDRAVLADLRFHLRQGERVVLLGRSGSGKSTLLNAAYARLAPEHAARIALVPQEHGLVPQLSVFHNTYMGRLDRHSTAWNLLNLVWPQQSARASVDLALDRVGLAGLARRPVGALSGGQKQRTALARAIHRGGDVLIADEPVSAVDERHGAALLDLLAARFPTMLVALHDVAQARRLASRIVGIRGGRLVLDQPAQAVTDDQIDALYRV